MQRLLVVLGVAVLGIVGYLLFGPNDAPSDAPATPSLQVTPSTVYPTGPNDDGASAVAPPEAPTERPLLTAEPVLEPAPPPVLAPVVEVSAASAPVAAAREEPTAAEPRSAVASRTAGAGARGGAIERPGCRVSLNRMHLARGVESREPFGVDTVFSSDDERVYVFMDVNNATGPERDMVIQWNHLDSPHTYEQRIPAGVSPRWRTWIYHTMRRPLAGRWFVRVTDETGCAVGEMTFRATPYEGRSSESARL